MAASSNPAAAASARLAACTIRSTRAQYAAPKHIGHGSQLAYRMAPERSCVPSVRHASRIATTSACSVGSPSLTTWFVPRPTTRPFSSATSAPKGPPSPAADSTPISMTSRSSSSSFTRGILDDRPMGC